MKKIAGYIGIVSYWLSWPLLFIYLKGSRRSRVLLIAEGKVLLIQNWHGPGKWSLPGGGVHKGEEPVLSATRELIEETGIALGKDQLKHIGTLPYRKHGLQFLCVYFVAELDQTITASPKLPEVLDVQWVDVRSLSDLQLATDAQTVLSLAGVIQ